MILPLSQRLACLFPHFYHICPEPGVLTSIVDEPAVLTAHGVFLFDHTHQVTFQKGDIQVLSSIEVPFHLEELFRGVPCQQGGPQLF